MGDSLQRLGRGNQRPVALYPFSTPGWGCAGRESALFRILSEEQGFWVVLFRIPQGGGAETIRGSPNSTTLVVTAWSLASHMGGWPLAQAE